MSSTSRQSGEAAEINRFIVACPHLEGASEMRWALRDCKRIELFKGKFEEVPSFDCMVTAGNSFGLMDAGIDLAVHKFFGEHVQERIQRRILEDYLGEQPVGTSIIVPTGHPAHRWVAHTPTMRIPMNIDGTDHVYLATWATLLEIRRANLRGETRISTVVFPAFGAGTGGVSYMEAGTQIRLAIEHFLKPPEFINPSFAQHRHERVHYGGKWGFQHPRHGSA